MQTIQLTFSYSQVVQTAQLTFSEPPPLRRENNTHYFNQRQLQQTTNQSPINFTLVRQQTVKPAAFSRTQKSTPVRGQQNNGPSENAVPAPAQTRDMNVIFTNTMQQLSHATEAIAALEKLFRHSFSENMTEEEQLVNLTCKVFSKDVFELLKRMLIFVLHQVNLTDLISMQTYNVF